jgi:DNA-binding transcriptional LysR family regulator
MPRAAPVTTAVLPSRAVIGRTSARARQHPDAEVQTLYLEWNEPRSALLDHRVDAAVTRLPLRTGGLDVTIRGGHVPQIGPGMPYRPYYAAINAEPALTRSPSLDFGRK